MTGHDPRAESDHDIQVLRDVCAEARVVLDHQLAVLGEIDDKAIWSVRTAVIVLGLLISAGSVADSASIRDLDRTVVTLAGVGTLALVFTIWFGMVTYHWSFEEEGIGPTEIAASLRSGTDERQWRQDLLRTGYFVWIDQQSTFNEYNQRMLLITHLTLSTGISLLLAAGSLYIIG